MACPIKLGDACPFPHEVPCTLCEQSLLEAQCCYHLHLLPGTIWKPHHSQNARCICFILRHFIMLRMLRHWEDCHDCLVGERKKEKKMIYSNSSMRLKYKLEKNNDISSSCSEVNYISPWIVSLTNKPKATTEGGC